MRCLNLVSLQSEARTASSITSGEAICWGLRQAFETVTDLSQDLPMKEFPRPAARHKTVGVKVGNVAVGGGAPIVVQSMTNTDTADVEATTNQVAALARTGSEI